MARKQAPKSESAPAAKGAAESKAAAPEPKPKAEPRAAEKPARPSAEAQRPRRKAAATTPSAAAATTPAAPSATAAAEARPAPAQAVSSAPAEPAAPAAAPETPPTLPSEAPRSAEAVLALVSEVEKWVARGMERLENKLVEVSKSVRDLLARGAPPPAPPKERPRAETAPAAELDDLAASVRRAMSEALDRKLEEVIAPTLSLYNRLRDEERALEKEPSSFDAKETRSVLGEAAAELEKILRLLGGDFIRPKAGEFYDPLIHLAVGEAQAKPGSARSEATVIVEVVSPGYKSARGKVICPAKVIVGKK